MKSKLSSGSRKITLRDVAARAKVSLGAASAAMRGGRSGTTSVCAKVIARVQKAAADLGYVPNAAARALRTQHTPQIGVLLPNTSTSQRLASPQSFETLTGVNIGLESTGYVVTLARLHDVLAEDAVRNESPLFKERLIEVAIAIGQFADEAESWIAQRLPKLVWVDGQRWDATCCVRRDEVGAGRMAVEKIAEKGWTEITVVDYAREDGHAHFSFAQRMEGIREEAKARGIVVKTITLEALRVLPKEELLNKCFLTIECSCAQQVYLSIVGKSLCLGKDASLVSCDEYRQQWWSFQDIARVGFDRGRMGEEAARMALSMLKGEEPSSVLVPNEWVAAAISTLGAARG